jgi:hypothetical protein
MYYFKVVCECMHVCISYVHMNMCVYIHIILHTFFLIL